MILLIVGLSAAVVGAFGPMLSPGFVQISADLGISVNTLSQSTAWLILTIGISLFFANTYAKIYGKRPVYILAVVIMFVGSVWGACAKEYNSFLASRIFSGFGMAPYEVLVQSTLQDIYYVHERATRIAIWNLFLLTGISGGSLISGYIIERLNWHWTFGICAILFGIFMFLIVFLVPETSFRRDPVSDTVPYSGRQFDVDETVLGKEISSVSHASETQYSRSRGGKITYIQSLRVYTGRYSNASFIKIFSRPLIVFFYPAVLWAFLIYGTTLTWIVVFSVVNAEIFTVPPVSRSGIHVSRKTWPLVSSKLG